MKRFQIALLSMIVMFLFTCSKDKDNGEEVIPSGNADTLMIEILTEISDDNKSFMDITPIPIPEELINYAAVDTGFGKAINAIEDFNNLLSNPGILLGASLKSTKASNWVDMGCDQISTVYECTWILDRGDYIYKVVQTMESLSNTIIHETFISGTYDGVFYGELGSDFYLISDWTTMFNDLQVLINIYFAPSHEGVEGKPVFTYHMVTGETRTIYSHWGGQDLITNTMYQNIIYTWDGINGHHESIHSVLQWEGDLLTTVISTWCPNIKSLMTTYGSTYNFAEHEGSWCHFDCDGIPFACGDY